MKLPPPFLHWPRVIRHSSFVIRHWLLLLLLALPGCGDYAAKQEDARILAEFRGPHFIPASERRSHPTAPPLVPHVVYAKDFDCLVCHAHKGFHFRGQPVKQCTHPERKACLQCHVPWQTDEQPFKFERLDKGQWVASTASGAVKPAKESQP
jgi:hypothetical protein